MIALVTGSSGFVGRHMAYFLRERGFDVLGVDIESGHDAFKLFRNDSPKYDLVVHAAAMAPHRVGIDTSKTAFAYNVALDACFFEWAMRTAQPRVVYLSSSAVYSDQLQRSAHGLPYKEHLGFEFEPHDDYGRTKRMGEQLAQRAQLAGVKVTVVRPFSGYGTDQSDNFPFGAFRKRALERRDPFPIWGSAEQIRDWIHIDDVVEAIWTLIENDVNIPVNLCTGRFLSMRDLARLFIRAVADKSYQPQIAVIDGAPLGVMHRTGNPSLLHRFYVPKITIDEGVERALEEDPSWILSSQTD